MIKKYIFSLTTEYSIFSMFFQSEKEFQRQIEISTANIKNQLKDVSYKKESKIVQNTKIKFNSKEDRCSFNEISIKSSDIPSLI